MRCTDEQDNACLLTSLVRSRSSQDLSSTSRDFEMDMNFEDTKNSLMRQGAFRKRTPETQHLKRRSDIEISATELHNHDLFCQNYDIRRPSVVCDVIMQRNPKNSVVLGVVKDIWKSMRTDIKEREEVVENQRKQSKVNGYFDRRKLSVEDNSQTFVWIINDISAAVIKSSKPLISNFENSWTEIIQVNENFTKNDCDFNAAIWELMMTESSCLNFLWIIIEVFIHLFLKLQERFDDLASIEKSQIFGNIEDVFNCHIQLWETCISLPLIESRRSHEPFDIFLMEKGFLSIASIMESYKTFMQLQLSISKRLQELEKSNNVFKEFIKWTKGYSKSYRDGIFSIVSVPFQRITKYKLLLERIKGFVNEEQKIRLNQMISSVHNFLELINSAVSGEKNVDELNSKLVVFPLPTCDFVDIAKSIDEKYLIFDLSKSLLHLPERILIHDGLLRLKLNNNKRRDVQCYLFNDLFLICKPFKKDWSRMTIYKSPIRIDKFMVKEESEGSFMGLIFNDFSIIESVIMFLGQPDEIKLWIDKCNKTRLSFQSKYEGTIKIPNRFFAQTSQTKRFSKEKSVESNDPGTKERNVSGYSTCRDSLECQISISSDEASNQEDKTCILIDNEAILDSFNNCNQTRNRLIT